MKLIILQRAGRDPSDLLKDQRIHRQVMRPKAEFFSLEAPEPLTAVRRRDDNQCRPVNGSSVKSGVSHKRSSYLDKRPRFQIVFVH